MSSEKIPDVYGPGTFTDKTFTPVPEDTQRIFRLITSQTPGFTQDERLLSKVRFTGESYPVIPGPIKAVSVAAALHAMTGVLADEILTIRGANNDERQITVNTTHAAVWFGCIATAFLDGVDVVSMVKEGRLKSLLPDWEQGWTDTALKYRATGLYPTNDPEVWYSLHGSMNADPVLRSIGVNPSTPIKSNDEAAVHIAQHTAKLSPEKMEMTNLLNGFCGSICFTPKQWRESEMGRSLGSHPLVNVKKQDQAVSTPPVAFAPLNPNDKRPLAGVKVVEMTRVIAGPEIGTILAAYGADVIRVNPPHLPDINIMQLSLNAGKRRSLDLPNNEAVLPSLPISDMSTGVLGAVGAMLGLKRRAVEGGSYYSHASLTGVNAYALTEDVGLYPKSTVEECKQRFQWGEMRGAHHVLDLLVTVWNGWKKVFGDYLNPEGDWFQSFDGSAFDKKRLTILRPVVKFERESETTPEWKTPSVPYAYQKAESVRFL
ncbi:hypothetical protein ColLi_03444 [Colletotrichum liriopes]|uniref:Alpha methylacyl-CoA racemase n=1 Tax=Colletotrichum liriopes TaxID=708192 RepID=A0AA37LQF7_9PEZI|nr:hypothetical protein ColLi_03444 [Colletotrichum liriopes]